MASFHRCNILIFIVLVALSTNVLAKNETNIPSSSNLSEFISAEVENEYIVTFKEYMKQSEHFQFLVNLIGGNVGWELVKRNNPAWNLPSDFSLIRILDTNAEFIQSTLLRLRSSERIRHVVPQRRFYNSLKQVDEPEIDIEDEHNSYILNMTGRAHTHFSIEDEFLLSTRKLHSTFQVPELFNAHFLWEKGFTGTGIRVAVFDTGLRQYHPHFKNVVEITNWTDENSKEDGLGHGTFVAGVIASQSSECYGFAPDVDMHVFRVFTNNRVSYTSWFLDAFNYAIHSRVHILNLSIGGPDFLDRPFVEKVWELSANNIIVVSAIGNDGPLYGTLNNPADQLDVIGVGGIDFSEKLASFSSRGMTTWELPTGYGRVKPDILAYGQSVQGSRIYGGCRALSGTSVASPVVAGAVALLASTLPEENRWNIINPASMKQVLVSSAERLLEANIFEQGAGKLNVMGAYELLQTYVPRASTIPSSLDLTKCPYMWPYCAQPIYYGSLPTTINMTILNGMGVAGEIEGEPYWRPGKNGEILELSFTYPSLLWPWTGYLGVQLQVHEDAARWEGYAEGVIVFTVSSPPALGETEFRKSVVEVPLKVHIVPTPPRSKRILWDQFHNLRYPSGYFPRDALDVKDDPFDWNADHPHTNFREMFTYLREKGYYIEILGVPFTCIDTSQYGTLMIVDAEEEYFPSEIEKLKDDVKNSGLSLLVIGDWYSVDVMKKINFFDENTRQWWIPVTGGANVPALNDLLKEFDMSFGGRVYNGDLSFDSKGYSTTIASGTSIVRFPAGGSLLYAQLFDQTDEIMGKRVEKKNVAIAGIYPNPVSAEESQGRIALFGDSSCLDDAFKRAPCFWILDKLIKYVAEGQVDSTTLPWSEPLQEALVAEGELPERMEGNDLPKYSKVVEHTVTCTKIDFKRYDKKEGETLEIVWENPNMLVKQASLTGTFREGTFFKSKETIQENMTDLFLPYVIGCVVVVFVVAIGLKIRKDRTVTRRVVV